MRGKHAILCCSLYRQEIERLNLSKTYPHVQIVFFHGRCGQPPIAIGELQAKLLGPMGCAAVDVLSGSFCVTIRKQPVERSKNLHVHGLRQCFHLIANPDLIDQQTSEGRHLVTPGWLSDWRKFITLWGFDQATAQRYFSESSTGIVLLDTGVDSAAHQNLREFSNFVDRPYQVMPVGLGFLDLFLNNIILHRQMESQGEASHGVEEHSNKKLSSYAMALDLLRTITKARREDDVVRQIIEMFTMLFAPRTVSFTRAESAGSPVEDRILKLDNGFILPLSASGKLLGSLELDGLQFPEHIDNYLNLASGIADVCGMAIENARHYQEIKNLSNTDGLTQIPNRRSFDEHFALEWKRMLRERKNLSVIMCDVDYFKLYNDTYGHQAGDDCLRDVAKVLALNCRRSGDFVARYGGEEFVLVLPDTNDDGAFSLAENIRQAIERLDIPHSDSPINPCVTLSLGVSCGVPAPQLLPKMLVLSADQALYEAKSNGRNQTVLRAFPDEEGGQRLPLDNEDAEIKKSHSPVSG